jgi:hypothetical protein
MRTSPDASPAGASLLAAFDLHETGVEIMRQNLRRRDPAASDHDIDAQLQAWLLHRPGAENGDCPGRVIDLETLRRRRFGMP